MFQLSTAFSVPIITSRLQDCTTLNQDLRTLFLAKAAEGDRYRNPDPFVFRNASLFESNFRLFDWPQPCVRKLRNFCLGAVYQTLRELNGYDSATLQRLHSATEAWFHLTRKGGYFGAHNHPMHSWSGVYCVCHDGDDPNSDSGKFSVISPFATSTMYIDYGNAHMKAPPAMGPRMMRLSSGDLLLFPSWVLHEVRPTRATTCASPWPSTCASGWRAPPRRTCRSVDPADAAGQLPRASMIGASWVS